MKQGKTDEAIGVYIRIKTAYGEPVSKTALEIKEVLKKEIEELSKRI